MQNGKWKIAGRRAERVAIGVGLIAMAAALYLAVRALRVQRETARTLRRDLDRAIAQIDQLHKANADLAKRIAGGEPPTSAPPANAELLKLRSEVAQQRTAARQIGPEEAAVKAWARQILDLKEAQQRMPEKSIPELQLTTEKDWADAAWDLDLTTDDGVRQALSRLRDRAVNEFFNDTLRPALKRYLEAHDNTLPADLDELKAYLGADSPGFDDDVFRRYRLLQSGRLSADPSQPILELVAHADPDYDSNHQMGINGASGGNYNRVEGRVGTAVEQFANANGGRFPTAPSDLAPYLEGIEPAAANHYLTKINRERSR